MNAKKLLTVTVTIAITTMFALASNPTSLSLNVMLIIPKTAFAQVPPAPFLPNGGDLTTDNQLPDNQLPVTNTQSQSQPPQPTTPTAANIPPPTIQITSHQDGSQVPVGELTIQGTSSDNQESNCQVYADVNDIAPLQNATAAGVNGGDDYSQWTFTYTQDYQVISQGVNELTAKISCFDEGGRSITAIPLSEWYSVNVTGVADGATTTTTTTITPSPSPVPSPTMTQAPSASALGAEQGATNIPSTIASPPSSFATPEGPSTGSNLGGSGSGDGDDDDDDDDDNGDDDGEDDGDDDDEGDDG